MPILEAGLFIVLSAVAFGLLIIKGYSVIKLISMISFWILAIPLLSGYSIVWQAESTDGSITIEDTKYLVTENTDLIGWIWFLMGFVALGMFVYELVYS